MATVYLGLGSNLGKRDENLRQAIERIGRSGVTVLKTSSFRETDPVGGPPQGKYLNAVLEGRTVLSPEQLLEKMLAIEHTLGRRRNGVPNAPRPIDIDVLLYDRVEIRSPRLTIPHPRMHERPFVLEPLKEIAPEVATEIEHGHDRH